MEIMITLFLGIWISLSGIICCRRMHKEFRENHMEEDQ